MSLSNMLEKTELKEIIKPILPEKGEFNLAYNKKAFSEEYKLLVQNNLKDKNDEDLSQKAFNYMAKFIIASFINMDGQAVLKNLESFKTMKYLVKENESDEYERICNEEINIIQNYIKSDFKDYEKIIPHSIFIAKLHNIKKSHNFNGIQKVLDNRNNISENLKLDVKEKCIVFVNQFIDSSIIKSDSDVIFDPEFGEWSKKCLETEADIFIDGVLYDFKCVNEIDYCQADAARLCGYYLLHKLTQINGTVNDKETTPLINKKINALACYKTRYGVIEKFNTNKFLEDEMQIVLEKSKKYIENYYVQAVQFKSLLESIKSNNNMSAVQKVMMNTGLIKKN